MHWWSPRLNHSGHPLAKLIILVFSICSIVKDLEKHEKIMKFRHPYGVTHKGNSVIFNDFHSNLKVDIWEIWFFKNRSGVYIVRISRFPGSLPRTTEGERVAGNGAKCRGSGPPLSS